MGSPSRLLRGWATTTTRRMLKVRRPHVLVACMPKSASSFLTEAIARLPGMTRAYLAWGYGWREQTLDVVALARRDLARYVCQQHLRYSGDVGEFIDEYRLTPVVLTRNLFDAVASVRDHFRNESTESPMAPLGPAHAKLPDDALEELIAEMIAPWYVSFFVSWQQVDCLRVTFDQVRETPQDVVKLVCQRAALDVSDEDVSRAVEAAQAQRPRYNKGVSGRGGAISPRAREKIIGLTRHFPEVDFTPIGIPHARA